MTTTKLKLAKLRLAELSDSEVVRRLARLAAKPIQLELPLAPELNRDREEL